ncbi:MAG: hypothetical protein P4L51_24665 [Puia sp.]|nr:hypothetical protein [Puia sp.]
MKLLFVMIAAILIGHSSQAQHRLKITKEKMEKYNAYSGGWSGWPEEYTYFQQGSEPVLEITNLDDRGVSFTLSVEVNGSRNSFTVSYTAYDAKNKWYKYTDENGDQVCIVGSTLSSLAQDGWPEGNRVQIYFWIYSQNYALVLE